MNNVLCEQPVVIYKDHIPIGHHLVAMMALTMRKTSKTLPELWEREAEPCEKLDSTMMANCLN